MKLKILNTREIKEINKQLKEQWGFDSKLDFVFLMNEKSKIYITNRDFAKLDSNILRINSVGLYFGEQTNHGIRLSIEGAQIIGPKAKKNTIEIPEEKIKAWFQGEDIEVEPDYKGNGFIILHSNKDFMGCGKLKDRIILNYVPKIRRMKPSSS